MTNETLRDMAIKIIIYGNPDALSKNREQLDIFLESLKSSDKTDRLLYTINFSSYPRLIRGVIKNQMQKNSQELGINMYADWVGVFHNFFKFDNAKVIFFLLDNNGLIDDNFYFQDATNTLNKIKETSIW